MEHDLPAPYPPLLLRKLFIFHFWNLIQYEILLTYPEKSRRARRVGVSGGGEGRIEKATHFSGEKTIHLELTTFNSARFTAIFREFPGQNTTADENSPYSIPGDGHPPSLSPRIMNLSAVKYIKENAIIIELSLR